MTRRKLRKLLRIQVVKHSSAVRRGLPVASALLACMHAAYAADPSDTATLEEVVVTAQKRTENLQAVPISIQALQTAGPGFEHTYIRGVVSGGDGNHSGSLPSVGMYLDEQPVTTIDGNLDIH